MAATKKRQASKKIKTVPAATKKNAGSRKNDFWKIEFNINTLYWVAIGIAVISTAIWTYNTNLQISELYDSIDQANNSTIDPVPETYRTPSTPQ